MKSKINVKGKVTGTSPKSISDAIIANIKNDPQGYANNMPIKDLVRVLRTLSLEYYNTGESIVSDDIFDKLKDVLERRDPDNVFLTEIGAPVIRNKVILPYQMFSLDKIKPEKENLESWLNEYPGPYVISDKLDGVSAQLHKESKNVYRLYSRGDGVEGQDISHLIQYVVPITVRFNDMPVGTSVRGEIIISKKDFEKIAHKMKNARNAVAGLVNSKTIDRSVALISQFVAYSVLHPNYKQSEQMSLLEQYKFKVVKYKIVKKLTYKLLSDLLVDRRENSEFEIDGIVVFDDSKVYLPTAGNPEHGFAFKTILQDQIAESKVIRIIWSLSMDGYIKPTIEIEPVELGGTTVKHATAFNAKYVVDNKLGKGAIVKIIRSGDVIPYILEIIKPAKEPDMPDMPYKWNPTGVDIIIKDLYGAQGDAIIIKRLAYFFGTVGVDNLGEGIITKLVNSGYKTVGQIIKAFLNNDVKLTEIEGMGDKSVEKIKNNIRNSLLNTKLETFMAASHMFERGMGRRKIREIIDMYPNIMNEKWNKTVLKEKIMQVPGFSDISSAKIADNFQEFKKFFEEINKIIDISYLREKPKVPLKEKKKCASLNGLICVFTGFRDKELEEKITMCGGKVSTGVSNKTSFVIRADNSTEKSGKVAEAEKLGIPVISKTEFMTKHKL